MPFGRLQASCGGFHSLKGKNYETKHYDHIKGIKSVQMALIHDYARRTNFTTKPRLLYPGYQRFFSPAARIFGVGRRPKPRAAKPSEKMHGSPIKTGQKPETALEKSLAPTVRLLNKILLHSVCIFISVKLRNFTISKRGMVVKFTCLA